MLKMTIKQPKQNIIKQGFKMEELEELSEGCDL